jgi:regulator of protease activity HflC (stomatin/prohibitin superfamily)
MMLELPTLGLAVIVVIFLIWFFNSVYVIKEWERGVVLRLGRMLPEAKGAGLRLVFFPIDSSPASRCASRPSTCRPRTSSPATTSR